MPNPYDEEVETGTLIDNPDGAYGLQDDVQSPRLYSGSHHLTPDWIPGANLAFSAPREYVGYNDIIANEYDYSLIMYLGGASADDDNDGLSEGTAMATLYAAYDLIAEQILDDSGVANYSAGVEFRVMQGARVGNPVPGGGIWLTNTAAQYAVTGWLRFRPTRLIAWGGGVDRFRFNRRGNRVAFLNGASGTDIDNWFLDLPDCAGFYMEGIGGYGWAGGRRLGCDPGAGHVTTPYANNQQYVDCSFDGPLQVGRGDETYGTFWSSKFGPCNAGDIFEIYDTRCTFQGNYKTDDGTLRDPEDYRSAAIYGQNVAYYYNRDCVGELGGGMYLDGNGGPMGTIEIDGWLTEGDFVSPVCPMKYTDYTSQSGVLKISSTDYADGTEPPNGFINLKTLGFYTKAFVNGQSYVTGPAMRVQAVSGYSNDPTHYPAENQSGLYGEKIWGRLDTAQRLLPGSSIVTPNLAPQDLTTYAQGGQAAVITAVRSIYGGLNAYSVDPSGASLVDQIYDVATGITYAVGDEIIFGGWIRYNRDATTPSTEDTAYYAITFPGASITIEGGQIAAMPYKGRGEWMLVSQRAKVTAVSDATGDLRFAFRCRSDGTDTFTFERPFCYRYPAGSVPLSNAEAAERMYAAGPGRAGATEGQFAFLSGINVVMDNLVLPVGGIYGTEISDPAAPSANTGVLYFRDNGSGKTQLCVRFPTGAVQVVATQP